MELIEPTLTLRKIILLKTVKGFCCLMQEIKNGIDRTHLNGFNATASGLYGLTVTCENGDRPQDWTFVSSGYEINMDEVE